MLNRLMNWRTAIGIGFQVFLIVGSFLPQAGELWLSSWWTEQQDVGRVLWRVTSPPISRPRWWSRVRRVYRWGRAVGVLSLSLWLLGDLLSPLAALTWAWLCRVLIWHVGVGTDRWGLPSRIDAQATVHVAQPESHVEVTIDLEPIRVELDDCSPISEISTTTREALTAKLERIRAECFQHPVGQAWMKQIDAEVQRVIQSCSGKRPNTPWPEMTLTKEESSASRNRNSDQTDPRPAQPSGKRAFFRTHVPPFSGSVHPMPSATHPVFAKTS